MMYINQTCPECGKRMIMYYRPVCLSCTPKEEIKKNLILSIDYIEDKYNIVTQDYAAKKYGIDGGSISWNCDYEETWKQNFMKVPEEYEVEPLKGYRFNAKGLEWCRSKEGQEFFEKRKEAFNNSPDGKCKKIPHLDWWHLLCNVYEFTNDCHITINWKVVYKCCTEDWQREITQLFIDEFGEEDILVQISW